MSNESDPNAEQFSYEDQSVLVTGAGRGIGRAIALEFADRGATVYLVSQSSSVQGTLGEIETRGGRGVAFEGSVADDNFVKTVVDQARPQIVVNAAATLGPPGRFVELSDAAFLDVLRVNVLGTAAVMRHSLAHMITAGFGRIINFAGGGAAYAYPGFAAYGVSKAALVRLTETVAVELGQDHPGLDVTVNVIAPGAVATDMLSEVKNRGGEVRTTVDIREPVDLVMFLASAQAREITGRFLHVRDEYRDSTLYESSDMLTLRRVERR
jgi:NAD(P)-dependent dehydrogenase (short-subunit alcohol dehydrogenase family)